MLILFVLVSVFLCELMVRINLFTKKSIFFSISKYITGALKANKPIDLSTNNGLQLIY